MKMTDIYSNKTKINWSTAMTETSQTTLLLLLAN